MGGISGALAVRADDGRQLMVESRGAPDGRPVFLLHGTPGSRRGPHPRVSVLYRLGVRLIGYDRPGYGESERRRGRLVRDAAADVRAIADALGLDRFAVVGRSGGAPHALACAALLPDRVTRTAALVSLAPHDAEGLDWFAGMTSSNVEKYRLAEQGANALDERLAAHKELIRRDPEAGLPFRDPGLPDSDRRVVADTGIRNMLIDSVAEAFKRSGDGWSDDMLAFCRPWGFEPADTRMPVLLWHGAQDVYSPAAHTLWLAARIRGATSIIESGRAHYGAVQVLPQVLAWLTADSRLRWLSAA